MAKKSKQTTEGKRGEKVGGMEEGEGRGRQGGGDVGEGGGGRRARQLRLDSTSASK